MKKTINTLLFIALICCAFDATAQRPPDPDSILVGQRKQPAILMIGSFHFSYYNFDAHKTDKNAQVDIKAKEKQQELEELMNYIYRFKPTKIAVEGGRNSGYLMKRYRAYRAGTRELGKDEMEQIGFRLLQKFNLDTIYGVNDGTLSYSLQSSKDSNTLRPILDSIYKDWDFRSDDTFSTLYKQWYDYKDQLALKLPLLDFFKYFNSDKVLDRGLGAYLIGDFTLGDTRGADALAMHWFSRNLRIYRHIQQIATSPDDRILVLFGQGHIQILKQFFECSPEFRLVKFNEL